MTWQGFTRMAEMLAYHAFDEIAQNSTPCQFLGNNNTKTRTGMFRRFVVKDKITPPQRLPESKNG